MMSGMDQRNSRDTRKDVLVILAVIATLVVLAVTFTWSRSEQPTPPLDTEIRTTPSTTMTP